MSNMATVSTCSKCGLSYRDSLIPHECAEWTKGRKEAKETQPVSDTLQEQEDAILTTIRNSDDAQREQVQESDWCDDCHGYVHAPWCPHYSETAKEVVTDQTATATHQPAARGGGGERDPWKVVHRIKLKHEKVVEAAKLLLAMNNCNYDRDQMRRSGGFNALQQAVEAIDPHWATINQQRSTSE